MELTKQDIDKVRGIEGFPLGNDENIIQLSNPLYYTACPNPFIGEFVNKHYKHYEEESDKYKREPFAADVSEGKNDPMYMAHSYHTKVPYKAIMRYILHYTEPGDIVFDGFCGTGMTGVAAQRCANPDKEFKYKIEQEMPNIKWGERKAILSDLAPAATFIAYNYNTNINIIEFEKEARKILEECQNECDWLYETYHNSEAENNMSDLIGKIRGKINYVVWSDVLLCPNCSNENVFWDIAVDETTNTDLKESKCIHCGLTLTTKNSERAMEMVIRDKCDEVIYQSKQVPVLIKYTVGKKQYKKKPDKFDFETIDKINNMKIPYWYPTDRMREGSESRRNDRTGIMYVDQFYTKRNLYVLASVFDKIKSVSDKRIRNHLMFWFSSIYSRSNKLNRYMPNHDRHVGPLSGTLYLPYFQAEINIIILLVDKLKALLKAGTVMSKACVTTQSMTNISNVEDSVIDYIFTDPPFGDSLNYSELSFIWEAWLKVQTNNNLEAIINKSQQKGLVEYQELMESCFKEYYRVLKPNRWITVEFHNSKNAVWVAIQEALIKAGFIVADVRTLDKVKGTTKQLSCASTVKQDLVISAYKPKDSFKVRFLEHIGSEETVWDFIREHMDKLPIVVNKGNKIESVREREGFLLFDRMVAYHIMSGIAVPMDASDFYRGLDERFIKRDGMYFLQDQVNEYDNARIISEIEPVQFSLFVTDEKNAIAWLYKELETPQTYGEIQPKFIQELRTVKYEKMPELSELLEENFIQNDEGKWYIPDPTKSGDIIKLREKRLIKEFEEYLNGKGKLKSFRTEAIRAGFAKLWKDKDYKNIVKVADRLPESVIQEDDKLLMYYDISLSRIE